MRIYEIEVKVPPKASIFFKVAAYSADHAILAMVQTFPNMKAEHMDAFLVGVMDKGEEND